MIPLQLWNTHYHGHRWFLILRMNATRQLMQSLFCPVTLTTYIYNIFVNQECALYEEGEEHYCMASQAPWLRDESMIWLHSSPTYAPTQHTNKIDTNRNHDRRRSTCLLSCTLIYNNDTKQGLWIKWVWHLLIYSLSFSLSYWSFAAVATESKRSHLECWEEREREEGEALTNGQVKESYWVFRSNRCHDAGLCCRSNGGSGLKIQICAVVLSLTESPKQSESLLNHKCMYLQPAIKKIYIFFRHCIHDSLTGSDFFFLLRWKEHFITKQMVDLAQSCSRSMVCLCLSDCSNNEQSALNLATWNKNRPTNSC